MQPKYEGKTVEEWFAEYTIDDVLGQDVHDRPFQELGTDAAWFLWGELTRRDSKATALLMAYKDKLTGKKRSMFGRTNEAERHTKAGHLIGRLGPAAEVLIPEIIVRLKSTDLDEAAEMAFLLGEIRRQPEVVIPEIHQSLLSTNWNFRQHKAHLMALSSFGAQAKAVLPELRSRLVNPAYTNDYVKFSLVNAILKINGPGPELGLYTNGLVSGSYWSNSIILNHMERAGTNARPAVPFLLQFAKTLTNQAEIDWVIGAVQVIDPEGIYYKP